MDFLDRAGLGQRQKVVVALLVAGAGAEALAAKLVLAETEPLDLRAHGAVEHQDALGGGPGQRRADFRAVGAGRMGTEQGVGGNGHGYASQR